MMLRSHFAFQLIGALVAFLPLTTQLAHPQTETVLYSFPIQDEQSPYPYAGVILDSKGNIYGTTWIGGTSGKGTVYKVSPNGVETVLYNFSGGGDGANPIGALVRDSIGNFYGTTNAGGANNYGTVFKLTKAGVETVLHSFAFDGVDGWGPWATLLRDKNGNLYGTTQAGGTFGEGTIFELTPGGTESLLYSFGANPMDGAFPNAELVRDGKGNLYGTTYGGGLNAGGTVFKMSAAGAETVLYRFMGGYDGNQPQAGMVRDPKGNLYGATVKGGQNGAGTIFRLSKKGIETVLLAFDGWDGVGPSAVMVRDKLGNIYGTAGGGGLGGFEGYGSMVELEEGSVESLLHIFQGAPTDGADPYRAALARDSKGNLYGTTISGGANGGGTIYKVVP
ncbi:MAG: choice-of-anchor tandem repeat GloVer-containing protein [Terriglobales bacterium]